MFALIALCAHLIRADRLQLAPEPGEGWWGVHARRSAFGWCWQADDGMVTKGPAEVTVATPLSRIPHFERVDALPRRPQESR